MADLDLDALRRRTAPGFVLGYEDANEVIQAVPDLLDHIKELEAERDYAVGQVEIERRERAITAQRMRDEKARADRAEARLARVTADDMIEVAAKAAYEQAFLKHAPEDVDRWDDLVANNDPAAESWREVARAAIRAVAADEQD